MKDKQFKEVSASTLMSDAKFYESYARFNDKANRYETWDEAVERVMDMHRTRYKDVMTPELEGLIQYSQDAYSAKQLLGAQRGLQFGGEQLLRNNAKLYNCFSGDTEFVTTDGVTSFTALGEGTSVIVPTHTGNYKKAVVRSYGEQQLYDITFSKGSSRQTVTATKDHRWLLTDGSETTSLKIGDRVLQAESSSGAWKVIDIAKASIETVWCLEVEDDKSFTLANGIITGNCTASYLDRVDFFKEALFLMLSGCGIGFSVQTHHISKLPPITPRKKSAKTFVVHDSIEGWADAVGALMSSYFTSGGDENYRGRKIYFDLNRIRPKGAEISGGFKAPGPEPLRIALSKIERLLEDELAAGNTTLRSIVAYDISMFMADAVISGGVRRAASICLFSKDDKDMITAKTGSWFVDNPQRGRSNNSVVLLRNDTTEEEFHNIMKSVQDSGEPGFVWTDDLEILFNPCVEVGMYAYDGDGSNEPSLT